jgi:hypothetical protein
MKQPSIWDWLVVCVVEHAEREREREREREII